MSESQETIYPVMAIQDMWHAAAAAIEHAAATDVDARWLLDLAGFIHVGAGPQDGLVSLNTTIFFADEQQADVARRYVRRAIEKHHHTG